MRDKKALRILTDAFWVPGGGWKERVDWGVDPASLEYARQAGYMFTSPWLAHDEIVARARTSASDLLTREVGAAFAASLSRRDLALRSALASFAYARAMPEHEWSGEHGCSICGLLELEGSRDLDLLSFYRHRWGGIRHRDPAYAWFDLWRFGEENEVVPAPADWAILRGLLNAVEDAAQDVKHRALLTAWKPLVPSNLDERRILLEILCISGVVRVKGQPSFRTRFTHAADALPPNGIGSEWGYPTSWWRGGAGVDWDAAREYFPDLDV